MTPRLRRHAGGYPLTPLFFLLLVLLLLVLLGGHNPRQAALGVAVIAAGLPVYYLLFRRTEHQTDPGGD